MLLTPGNYTFAELSSACRVSRSTAEKFKDRFQLMPTTKEVMGRDANAVVLTEENINTIARHYPWVLTGVSPEQQQSNDTQLTENAYGVNAMSQANNAELTRLRDELEQERLKNARMEGDLKAALSKLEEKDKLIEEKDKRFAALEETINAQKLANDALNNERFAITQQLQRYRSQGGERPLNDKPFWKFWGA